MAPRPGATSLARRQRSRAPQVLVHQGKSSTGDERKEDQVNRSQEVVQGWKALSISLVQRNVNRCPRFPGPMLMISSFDLNSGTVPIRGPRAGEVGGLAGSGIGAHQQAICRRGAWNDLERQVLIRLQRQVRVSSTPLCAGVLGKGRRVAGSRGTNVTWNAAKDAGSQFAPCRYGPACSCSQQKAAQNRKEMERLTRASPARPVAARMDKEWITGSSSTTKT